MKSGSRFIKDVKGLACISFRQFRCQFHTLAFSTGKSGRRLSQLYISESDILQYFYLIQDLRNVFKEFYGTVDCHVQYIGNRFSLETYFQCFPVITFAVTYFTRHIYVRKEIHFNCFITISRTGFTTSAWNIKGETSRLVTANLSFRKTYKQITNIRKHTSIGSWIGTWRTSQRWLIDIHYLIDVFQSFNRIVFQRILQRTVELLR